MNALLRINCKIWIKTARWSESLLIQSCVCQKTESLYLLVSMLREDVWFNLDLVNYQAQLVNGSTRMTPPAGIEIFMPDVDEKAPQKASQAITLEWLRDRNRSLPPDVSAK